ncbi:MAG: ComF family protein [Candidatus Eremiobacteraeota bacterium]|nr:ComF family protein [Candidatus Eremiobacteraeota bacterium]MBV8671596.1 ComF family protein [Candidatus Eremiobacteraeota bacterium]
MFGIARAALVNMLDMVAPVRCAMCGHSGAHLCEGCCTRYERGSLLMRPASPRAPCVYALGAHDGYLRKAILAIKYRNRVDTAYALGVVLGRKLPGLFEAVVPVPLHRQRYRVRGCNQAEVIARGVVSTGCARLIADALERRKATLSQSSLHLHGRERNVREAFSIGARAMQVQGLRVLIIDDVVTTGATISACTAVLRSAGIDVVGAAALALRR